MSSKADFNAEEWSLLRQGPALAGIYTLMAERGGRIRESLSIAECYGDARERWWGPPRDVTLVAELASEGPELDRTAFGSLPDDVQADEVSQRGLERLTQATGVLRDKASTEELEDYKAFVLGLARRVAESHKAGSFLGIGGERVTDREQAALDKIAAALETPA